jgi:hypothetical protein
MRYLTVAAAICLTACVTKTDWVHPKKPPEAMYQDFKECEKESRSIKGPRARAEMRDLCMRGKGWQ